MTVRWLLAAFHLLALGIGMESVWARGRALRRPLDADGLKRVFTHDNWYGIAALLWFSTGIARAFFGFEKGTDYYLHQPFFLAKLAILVPLLVAECWVAMLLMKWRRQVQKGEVVDTSKAPLMSRISAWETLAIMLIVFLATAVARNVRF